MYIWYIIMDIFLKDQIISDLIKKKFPTSIYLKFKAKCLCNHPTKAIQFELSRKVITQNFERECLKLNNSIF